MIRTIEILLNNFKMRKHYAAMKTLILKQRERVEEARTNFTMNSCGVHDKDLFDQLDNAVQRLHSADHRLEQFYDSIKRGDYENASYIINFVQKDYEASVSDLLISQADYCKRITKYVRDMIRNNMSEVQNDQCISS